jgi:hypothetical protein
MKGGRIPSVTQISPGKSQRPSAEYRPQWLRPEPGMMRRLGSDRSAIVLFQPELLNYRRIRLLERRPLFKGRTVALVEFRSDSWAARGERLIHSS